LGQQLTGLKLDLNWIRKKMNGNDPILHEKILEINRHLDDTVRTVRNISAELRPLLLDDLGLIPAIEHYCEEFHARTGILATFSFDGQFPVLSDAVNSNLFRIFQESLTNVMRHSNARSVIVQLTTSDATLCLTIRDDGDGFETDRKSETLGLVGMKERAIALGGHLVIRSSPGKGTAIEVDVPLTTPFVA
jgi:signal transduction histidine kinase